MERHKCKLCSRTFANGRALGGHMKAHLATLPLPPKPQPLPEDSASFSFNSSSEHHEEAATDEKALIYGLRENPKKCFRLADPEFDTGSVVQDRESETESKNPTRRRSKRTRRPANSEEPKRPKLSFMESPEPASSVSDTSPEEDVAMCLMMLSRDRWSRSVVNNDVVVQEEEGVRSLEIKSGRVRGKHQCHSCGKTFRSSRALGSHRSICEGSGNDSKIFECPFCAKVFGSGQALGGHKRSHLMPSSSSNVNDSTKLKESFIDLNLPAPPEDDDLSVLSDA
ncbi:Zinc finger protein ZAT9 [Spatholobus suberectus]|nr:Zinc finger protein ZAT9 [Spatholobus suberectus]